MQYCPKCKMQIRGHKRCCPLCQGPLTGEPEEGSFPVIERPKIARVTFMKLVTFTALSVFVVLLALAILLPSSAPVLPWVFFFTLFAWIDIGTGVVMRHNVIKQITFQIYFAMLATLIIDHWFGRIGWSVSFVLPFAFVGLIASQILIAKVTHLSLETYATYLFFDVILSQLQWITVLNGINRIPAPAVITMCAILIGAIAGVLFKWNELKTSLEKWFNV